METTIPLLGLVYPPVRRASPPPHLSSSFGVSVERDWIRICYPFPSNPVMLAVSCSFYSAAAGAFEYCSARSKRWSQIGQLQHLSNQASLSPADFSHFTNSDAEKIKDIIMFRRPLGAWYSILFLLGNNVEPKGKSPLVDDNLLIFRKAYIVKLR